jgi:hypothetical protein
MDDDLVAFGSVAQGTLGQEAERVGISLRRRHLLRVLPAGILPIQRVPCGVEGLLQRGSHLGLEPAANHEHPVLVGEKTQ